jgi:ATP-binding cassette subfamily B protein
MGERGAAAGEPALEDLSWPKGRLPEALEQVFGRTLASSTAVPAAPPGWSLWMEASAGPLGVRVEPVAAGAENLAELLPRQGVLLLALGAGARFLLVRRVAGRRQVSLDISVFVAPGRWVRRPVALLAGLGGLDGDGGPDRPLGTLGRDLGLDPRRAAGLRALLARAHRTSGAVLEGWLLSPVERRFRDRLAALGAPGLSAITLGAAVGYLLLLLGGWALVGAALLQGRLQPAWLLAWVLVLGSMVALRFWAHRSMGTLAVFVGGLMRERLLEGILRLPLQQVKKHGVGYWFGAVLEVEAMEALARAGSLPALMSALQVLVSIGLLGLAVGPAPAVVLGGLGLAAMVLVLLWYWRAFQSWTGARLALTDELCEKMLGHRTLVAQLAGEERHLGEDQSLLEYERAGSRLHDRLAILQAGVPRAWLVAGLILLSWLLLPERLVGGPAAVGLAGLMLGYTSFRRLAVVVPVVAGAALAFTRTREIFAAAATEDRPPSLAAVETVASPSALAEQPTLVARRLEFCHPGRSEPVLRDSSFEIHRGERIIVHGGSGSGKSTFASLVSGLRTPTSGVLLYRGIDHHSLGLAAWRRQVVLVPQFQDNHMLSAPLLFNLLLARRWPPLAPDIKAAEEVCRALGLGPLIEKMPAGLAQMVGDSGWQLSQGEQSRVFLARALLQPAQVHVLDEPLAAVDGETALAVLETVLARVETLVAIHHD